MSWFERLRAHLHDTPHQTSAEDRRLAAAVLLLELTRADAEHHPAEAAALREGLVRDFAVTDATLDALLAAADKTAKESVSLYAFAQTLNRSMDQAEKRALVELLWQVSLADGRVDPHEEHLLRRMADMLHLSHGDFIRAKHRAQEKISEAKR